MNKFAIVAVSLLIVYASAAASNVPVAVPGLLVATVDDRAIMLSNYCVSCAREGKLMRACVIYRGDSLCPEHFKFGKALVAKR